MKYCSVANRPRSDVADTLVHTYDAQGNRETTTDALGFVTTYDSYDAHGKLLQMTDPNGLVTEYRYDDRDRLTRVLIGTPGNWETTVYDYDDAGNLTRLTLPDGSFLDYGYDDAGRMNRITDALGNRIDYGYNGIGERTSEQTFDAENQLAMTMSRAFDALGRLDTITGADPADITDFDHDANGNETRQQSPLHANPSISDYDELDRLSFTTDPTGARIEYRYDAQDNLHRVIDPRDLVTTYGYNGFNELTALTSPDTGNTGYDYDPAGNLDFQTDARGVRADYDYDAADRLTVITYPDEQLDFVYDETTGGEGRRGRLTTASTAPRNGSAIDATETGYSYDRHGRILSKTQQIGSADALITEHDYDDNGRIETTTLPSGVVIGYGYGSDGRVLSIRVNGVEIVREVEYFPLGEAKSWRYGSSGRYEREFDADGRIDEHTLGASTREIDFDTAGRITDIADSAPAQSNWSYEYDDADRLKTASNAATSGPTAQQRYVWEFDPTGNRTEQHLAIGAGPTETTDYSISLNSNRLDGLSGAIADTRVFDEVGNTTRWRSQGGTHNGSELTASYSGRNRQTRVNRIDGGGEARIARYAYNAFGERVAKWTGAAASQPTAAPTRQYVYDEAGHLVGEYDASGELVTEHIWLEDTPVAVLKPTGSAQGGQPAGDVDVYHIHPDQLDTPRAIVNAADTQVWRWESSPFGDTEATTDPAGFGSFNYTLRFPGQQYDEETGSHYNYFRDYEAATGRYLQSDPIGLSGGVGTYFYVTDDPLYFSDPIGLKQGMRDRWCDLMDNPLVSSSVRGWLKNQCRRPSNKFRAPPGLDLAHRYKCPADCGFGYEYADPKWTADHRGIEHRYYRKRGGAWSVGVPKICRKNRKLDLPPRGALP